MSVLGTPEPTGHRDAVFGLWERDDRILLVSNARVRGGRATPTWDLPGGAVRNGEELVQALSREWREEVGVSVAVGPLQLVVDGAKRRAKGTPPLYTWRAFVFRVVGAGGTVLAGEGIEDLRWARREEAAEYLSAPYHEALRRHLAGDESEYATCSWIDPLSAERAPESGDALRRLLVIAACAAAGATDLVRREVQAAAAEGVPRARVEEALLQVVPYAGFPRTIAAFTAATNQTVPGTKSPLHSFGDDQAGRATFRRVYGETADRVAAGLQRLHPALREWTHRFAYGTVLGRPVLTLLERELLAVALLTALGNLADPLLGHMRAALRLGATRDDVAAAIAAVPHALGEARRDEARGLLDRL